jgi:hypothetical protein
MTDLPDPIRRDTLRLAQLPDEDELDELREHCGDPCYGCGHYPELCWNCKLE